MTANTVSDPSPGDRGLEKLLEAFADAWNRHDVAGFEVERDSTMGPSSCESVFMTKGL